MPVAIKSTEGFQNNFAIPQAKRVRNLKTNFEQMELLLASYGCTVEIHSNTADMLIKRGTSKNEYYCHKCHKIKNRSEFIIYEYMSKSKKYSLTRKKCNDCMKAKRNFYIIKEVSREAI